VDLPPRLPPPSERTPYRLAASAVLTLGAGLAVTAILAAGVLHLEQDKQALAFERQAGIRVAAIRRGLDQAIEVVAVTNTLFRTVGNVSEAQFHTFTGPLIERNRFIKAFTYHQRLLDADRPAFEAAMARSHPGSMVRETRGGLSQSALRRPAYNPALFVEPYAGNEAAYGFDVATSKSFSEAVERAVDSGKAAATRLIYLLQGKKAEPGFLLVMPVYRTGLPPDNPVARRAALIGDTAVSMRAADLVEIILADQPADERVHLTVSIGNADGRLQVVYPRSAAQAATRMLEQARASGASLPVVEAPALDAAGFSHISQLDVGGQPWRIGISATPGTSWADHLGSVLVAIGGTLLTLMLAAMVQSLSLRSRRVEKLVQERTADLELSNQALIDDVAARRRAEKALQDSEQRFRQLVSMSSDWYWEQDAGGRFTAITGGFVEKAGLPLERLMGQTSQDTAHDRLDSDSGRAHLAQVAARQGYTGFEYAVLDEGGGERWFSINGEPVFDDQQVFQGYRGTGTDITARKRSEQAIHHVAQHDVLTGLPNRSLLQDRLGQAVAYSDRTRRAVWVMLIDLDRFKFVNDSMGHKAGDVLLMTVAARLRSALRETDTVARMSGDEFVVILTEHEDEQLKVDVVQRLMESVAQPVMLGIKEFFVTCSIGVSVYPLDGAPADSLLEMADIAMYRAKKLGRNNFQFYTPSMNEEAMERVRIESALRSALVRNEFVLHYQPQVDLASGQIVGMEALIRWQHPEMGMVAPNRFIGVAEETGLIVPIGAWVIGEACRQARAWHDAGLGALRVAVNLSARQFGADHLLSDLRDVLASTGLPPACLEIELTESLFMSDVGVAVELLHQMKALGITLAIDDFGTGYSSLSYLSRFPIDVLKIDRSFVAAISRDANDAAIVASIVALAHNLKLAVIAEGVETVDQLDYLQRHGCDQMQGFYYSRPLPAAQFEALVREKRSLSLGLLADV
jgi:diguanylate cyclase (GGDEF)-like protein/PAS domain S-box-containing protein